MNTLLSIRNLSISFTSDGSVTQAVKNLSLEVNRGEIVALVGESGSGKSVTSLSILGLLPVPPASYDSGEIMFTADESEAINLLSLTDKHLRNIRGAQIGMIFQEPMTSLNPVFTCGDQVSEAILAHKKISPAAAKAITLEWFAKVKLPDPETIFYKYPHQLSGGQKQRVMIAMAMCNEPALLICDEPTTALDVTVQNTILQLIKDLQRESGIGVIFITHDLGVVASIADRVAIMYRGELVEQGTTTTIFNHAAHPYTQALIACRPALHPKGQPLPVVADFLEGKKPSPAKQTVQNSTDEKLVQVRDLTVKFPKRTSLLGKPKSWFIAVDGVNFDIMKGETLGLVGESGCGKTTLGRTLLGLVSPASGSIIYQGRDLTQLGNREFKKIRQAVQLIFQDPYSSLNPRMTIGEAIAEPMKVAGLVTDAKERKRKVQELLEKVNLAPSMASRYPHEFSGGQRQRIVIARALSLDPHFLVCDESVSALDVSVQAQVLNLLNELKSDLGLTMLFISHDLSVVRYLCDRIMVMKDGQIIERGPAEQVYRAPQSAYTKSLIEAIPNLAP